VSLGGGGELEWIGWIRRYQVMLNFVYRQEMLLGPILKVDKLGSAPSTRGIEAT
jgi:hypothetical protein